MRQPILILMLLTSVLLLSGRANGQRQISIIVTAETVSEEMKSRGPLLLRITISNGLSQDIRFSTFSLKPNSWNGEVANISLVDVYRDVTGPTSVFLARPKLGEVPKFIAGMASYPIKPGESRSVVIDISKWQIRDGWATCRYRISLRADNIEVDDYTTASVMSDPIEIEIK